MYDQKTIETIKAQVARIKVKFSVLNVPVARRQYFVRLAKQYGLVEELTKEIERRKYNSNERITTMQDIAEIFGVNYDTVRNFLRSRLDEDILTLRTEYCRQEGRVAGGENRVLVGAGHVLTLEEKSRGGRN